MLVLSRRIGEEILIAGHIRVTVLSVQGNKVRLGISAPGSVTVLRSELLTEGTSDDALETADWPAFTG
jgi:carbon storage regulator